MKIRHEVNYDHLAKVLHARRMVGFGEGFLVKQRSLKVTVKDDAGLYRKVVAHVRNARMTGEAA